MIYYVDTSFLLLALLDQEGRVEAERVLQEGADEEALVSSALLEVELKQIASRAGLPGPAIDNALAEVELFSVDMVLREAGIVPGPIKTLDAVHVATAMALDSPLAPVVVLTHDRQMAACARRCGLEVVDVPGHST